MSSSGSPCTTSRSASWPASTLPSSSPRPSSVGAVLCRPADHLERGDAELLHVDLELGAVVAVRHHGRAEVVADHELHAGRDGLGQHAAGVLEVLAHAADARVRLLERLREALVDRAACCAAWSQFSAISRKRTVHSMLGATKQPAFEDRVDALAVHAVGVVDDVDARARALEDRRARRAVRAHALAELVRGVDGGAQLVAREIQDVARGRRAVAGRRGDLHHVDAAPALLAHGEPPRVGAVDLARESRVAELHEPVAVVAEVGRLARRHELHAAGEVARALRRRPPGSPPSARRRCSTAFDEPTAPVKPHSSAMRALRAASIER